MLFRDNSLGAPSPFQVSVHERAVQMNQRIVFIALFIVGSLHVPGMNSVIAQTIPAESQLPDQAYPVPIPGSPEADAGSGTPPIPGEATVADQLADDKKKDANVPAESALPGEVAALPNTNNGLPGGLRPWLRLDLKGHTGIIRAIDSGEDKAAATIVSAGEDKDVHVWQRSELTRNRWVHRRTIRWPIVRGPRGRIYSVALRGREVALAGHGSTGGLGEIWVVNVDSGELVRSLVRGDDEDQSHRQTIATLRWSPNPKKAILASVDVEGRVIVWQSDVDTGLWTGKTLVEPDRETYGEAAALALRSRRRFVPLTFLGQDHIVVAKYAGSAEKPAGAALWQLVRINIDSGESVPIQDASMIEFAVAMDASSDGRVMVAGDAMGNVKRIRLDRTGKVLDVAAIDVGGVALSIDVDDDGHRVLIGSPRPASRQEAPKQEATEKGATGQVQVWNLESDQPTKLSTRPMDQLPLSVSLLSSPLADTWGQAAVTQSSRLDIHSIEEDATIAAATQTLQTDADAITKVAFASDSPGYRVAMARSGGPLTDVFDLTQVKLLGRGPVNADDYVPNQKLNDKWTARLEKHRRRSALSTYLPATSRVACCR